MVGDEPSKSALPTVFVIDNTFFCDAFKSSYDGREGLYQYSSKLLLDYLVFKSATTGGSKLAITSEQVKKEVYNKLGKLSDQLDLAINAFIHVVPVGKPDQTINHKESVLILSDILGTEYSGRLNIILATNREKAKLLAFNFYHPNPNGEKPRMKMEKFNPPYAILNTDGVVELIRALDRVTMELVSQLK